MDEVTEDFKRVFLLNRLPFKKLRNLSNSLSESLKLDSLAILLFLKLLNPGQSVLHSVMTVLGLAFQVLHDVHQV